MLLVYICCFIVADCAGVRANGGPEIASFDGKMYIESEFELGRSIFSVVFGARPLGSLEDVPYDKVIKYSCTDMRTEFTAMRALNQTNITPKVYYVSPLVHVAFPGASFVPERCVGKPLNYLVMGRVGRSVARAFQRVGGPVLDVERKKTAVKLLKAGISAMSHLQRMHKGGVVHGDVHAGNIAYRCDDLHSGCETIVLIDFGEASQVGKGSPTPRTLHPFLLSPWQLLGRARTHRDDVYRLVQVLVDVAANFQLIAFMMEAVGTRSDSLTQAQVQKLADWKFSEFGFAYCFRLPTEVCTFLSEHLVPIVVRLTDTDLPDHSKIISVLKRALSLVQPPAVAAAGKFAPSGTRAQPALAASATPVQPTLTGNVASTVHATRVRPAVTGNVASTDQGNASTSSSARTDAFAESLVPATRSKSYIPTSIGGGARGIVVFPVGDRMTTRSMKRANHTPDECQNQIASNSAVGKNKRRAVEDSEARELSKYVI